MGKWKKKLSILLVALFTVVFFSGHICANASTGQKIKKSKITKSTKKNPKIKPAAKNNKMKNH